VAAEYGEPIAGGFVGEVAVDGFWLTGKLTALYGTEGGCISGTPTTNKYVTF
jgi:hypothetical protein